MNHFTQTSRGRDRGARLGDLEAGVLATSFGDATPVISGGLACVVGALVAIGASVRSALVLQDQVSGRAARR